MPGRAGMVAELTRECVSGRLGSPPSVNPTGWGLFEGMAGVRERARGHLLAAWFGGPGNMKQNLVPLFRSANVAMRDKVESVIAKELTNGQFDEVFYRVLPIYPDASNPIPRDDVRGHWYRSVRTAHHHRQGEDSEQGVVMSVFLEQLMRLVPPPEAPICAGSPEAWVEVERKLGAPLPDDYKIFINRYGSGGFYDYLEIVSPFMPRNGLIAMFWRYRDSYKQDKFPVFPEPEGLLLLGTDQCEHTLFWLTKGEPNQWPLVYMDDNYIDTPRYEYYEMTITQFLVEWISGRLDPPMIRDLKVRERKVPIFAPSTPRQVGLE